MTAPAGLEIPAEESGTAAPLLRMHQLTAHIVVRDDAPRTPHAPRDLPDLARFLFHTLAPADEQRRSVLDEVSLELDPRTCLALVGVRGAGKSTLARVCARLHRPSSGAVEWRGVNLHTARGESARSARRAVQVLLDDPGAALDPRRTVAECLALALEGLEVERQEQAERIERALAMAGLSSDVRGLRTDHLSAGARRLAGLSRALVGAPEVLVADEPTSGLDPAERGRMLEVLAGLLTPGPGPALLLLTRDLAAVRALAHRVGVLHDGKLVEIDATARVFDAPEHPHTQALLASAPRLGAARIPSAIQR